MTEGSGRDDEPEDVDLDLIEVADPPTKSAVAPVPSLDVARSAMWETSLSRLPLQLGRYTLTKRLGIGGMAEVFLAEQQGAAGFKKACVVKRMLSHLTLQPRYVEMFLREARLASTLSHANIVQIWDLGEVDGQYFIAMEYIDGMPLNLLARSAWRAGRAVPMEVICCALADAAEGLAVAHERVDAEGKPSPIVHRDISPDNLMIDRDGVTKILDFGIARTNDSERTQAGELKGKVPFMPIEQLRGEVIDARADVYALGVTAYWLLTGQRPFSAASDLALIEVIASQAPRPPIELNPHIPPQLNELVLRMIERERDQRLASVREVSQALEHVTAQRKTVVVPFVRAVMEELSRADPDESFASASSGLASTPHTDTISGGWRARSLARGGVATALVSRAAVASTPSGPIAAAPPGTASATPEAPKSLLERVRARPGLAVAAGAFAVTAATLLVLAPWTSAPDDALLPPPPAPIGDATPPLPVPLPLQPALPPPQPAPAPPQPAPPTDATPPAADPTADPLQVPPVTDKAERAAKRSVVVKGPPEVQWLHNGKSLGSGSQTLKLPASARSLVAYDKKRAARTTVPIGAATIDYAALPKGKLQPRAKPFADVFIGSVALGATPFPAVDVVAGSYRVRFVYKGTERTQTVVVEPGAVVRPSIDFTQP